MGAAVCRVLTCARNAGFKKEIERRHQRIDDRLALGQVGDDYEMSNLLCFELLVSVVNCLVDAVPRSLLTFGLQVGWVLAAG